MRTRLIWLTASMFVLALPAWAEGPDGKAGFDEHCAKCHGDTGHSDTAVGRAMKVPALADQKWGEDAEEKIQTAFRENPKHKSVAAKVSDADLEAIVGYVKSLASGG
jgi:mono/diheme cytochrome c family protein